MFCPKCGTKVDANDKFCPSCGTPISVSDVSSSEETVYVNKPQKTTLLPQRVKPERPPRKPLSKGKKALAVIITILIVAIGLGITALVLIGNSAAKEAANYLERGKYEQATKLYKREIADNKILNSLFKKMVKDKIDAKIKAQSEGKLKYKEAIDYFSAVFDMEDLLDDAAKEKIAKSVVDRCAAIQTAYSTEKKMDYDKARAELLAWSDFERNYSLKDFYETDYSDLGCAKTVLEAITKLKDSDKAFTRGEELFASGDYEAALAEYAKVDESSEHYEEAQEKSTQAIDLYRDKVLEEANRRIANNDYPGAIAYLENVLEFEAVSDDVELKAELETLKTTYVEKVKSDALTESAALRADKKYLEAMDVIDNALSIIGDDSELQREYDSCINSYVEQVTNEVNAVLEEDWEAAYQLIQTANQNLPGNAELNALMQNVLEVKPVNLIDLVVVDSACYRVSDVRDGIYDSYGNFYQNCPYLYDRYGGNGRYVIYNLSEHYSSFSCTFAPTQDFGSTVHFKLRIYLDDNLIYEKYVERTTAPFKVNLPVQGVTLLEIHMEEVDGGGGYDGQYNYCGIIIAYGVLKK